MYNAIDINQEDVLSRPAMSDKKLRIHQCLQGLLLWHGKEAKLAMGGRSVVQGKESRARPKRECLNGQ